MQAFQGLKLIAAIAVLAVPSQGESVAADLAFADGLAAEGSSVVAYGISTACCEAPCYADDVCGDACDSACGCGDSCADPCCSSSGCASPSCGVACRRNCGLLGHGLLTYDTRADDPVLPALLLGRFQPTEPCFDDFISPMTNPVFFEDPRNVTELRGIFLQHRVPQTALGGDIQLYALQLRARLTERLSLIAAKDGFIVSENPLIQDGWADVDIGFKYALIRNAKDQRLLSAGVVYDLPVGTPRAQQGRGDGEFHLFLTGGAQLGECGHWLSAAGLLQPVDDGANASFAYWSNHFDYQVRHGWYTVTEFNWFHYTADGDNALGLTGLEGGDLFNLGSAGVDGNDIVTGAVGVKYKPNRKTELGVAWEVPLTERRDVLDNRLTVDLILRY